MPTRHCERNEAIQGQRADVASVALDRFACGSR
ncbi:hypothetical protein EKPJFOCH_2582 [Methylobacterium thuringiense]|uniref:Uncharacterized protein n=1 Tax=Methylobacterium thuringiense TaxID=1003091 RepID=A0ABQ4TPW3_9HYPH|nr:hypothetical protein EKPJFOCH_2582 [Methylobacterium thuringiense]